MFDEIWDEIEGLFAAARGEKSGTGPDPAERGLRCAALARRAGAGSSMVTAALLHDLGRMLGPDGAGHAQTPPERMAANWLSTRFGPMVSEPVRHHGEAIRYLAWSGGAAADPADLAARGGAFDAAAAAAFVARPFAREAVELRLWVNAVPADEAGLPSLITYRDVAADAALAGP